MQLLACSMVPLKKTSIPKQSRIGIIIGEFPSDMTHVHIGTTIFNNFSKEYSTKNNFKTIINNTSKKYLNNIGYESVVINLDRKRFKEIDNLVSKDGANILLSPSAGSTLEALRKKYNVDMIISFKTYKSSVYLKPDSYFEAGNYGLFTRSSFGRDRFMVYSFMQMEAINISPPTVNAFSWQYDNPELESINAPKDFHNFPSVEMNKVEESIIERIKIFVSTSIQSAVLGAEPPTLKGAHIL